jgi:hypothetical protein
MGGDMGESLGKHVLGPGARQIRLVRSQIDAIRKSHGRTRGPESEQMDGAGTSKTVEERRGRPLEGLNYLMTAVSVT